jgi:hypothetical protein
MAVPAAQVHTHQRLPGGRVPWTMSTTISAMTQPAVTMPMTI